MTKTVYIWETEDEVFEFVSETLEAGEREFAKRYSGFSLDDAKVINPATHTYRYIDDRGEPALGWVLKVEFIQEEEE